MGFYIDSTLEHFVGLGTADIPCDSEETTFISDIARAFTSYSFDGESFSTDENNKTTKMFYFYFDDFDDAVKFLKIADNRYVGVSFFNMQRNNIIEIIDWLSENEYTKHYKIGTFIRDTTVLAINNTDIAVQFKLWYDDNDGVF